MPGSGRAPWVTGKGGVDYIHPPLFPGGVELLRDTPLTGAAKLFNCFVIFFYKTFETTNIYILRILILNI